jgi:acetyl-CoA C-acetyltransferase
LVVCAHRVSDTPATQYLFNTIFDPIYERQFALNTISMWALAAQQHMARYGTTEEQMARVSVTCHHNALNNAYAHLKKEVSVDDVLQSRMLSWPLKLLDACPRSDGASAAVLASEKFVRSSTDRPAWVKGFGSSSNGYFLGDRKELCFRSELARAATQAFKAAKIEDPVRQIQVAEMANPFTIAELMAIEAVGFCPKGKSGSFVDEGVFEMDGRLPINPSGGTLCSNPIGVGALTRIVEAALQVMGKADGRQISNVENAVAQTSGGAIQFGTVVVLGSTK